jgi:hypothetical protein
MSTCEKCWADSNRDPYKSTSEEYRRLLAERGPTGCTGEQQAGPDATPCPECGGRLVRHQYTGECMVNAAHGRPSQPESSPSPPSAPPAPRPGDP